MYLWIRVCLPMVIALIFFCIIFCGNIIYHINKENKRIKLCNKVLGKNKS